MFNEISDPMGLPLFFMTPEPEIWELFYRLLGMNTIALHFDWLWFNEMISICCKEKFSMCGQRITIIKECENKSDLNKDNNNKHEKLHGGKPKQL